MNNADLKSLCSALFVPLADERFLAKAHERGAFALHRRMIDAPVVDQARATLARVRR